MTTRYIIITTMIIIMTLAGGCGKAASIPTQQVINVTATPEVINVTATLQPTDIPAPTEEKQIASPVPVSTATEENPSAVRYQTPGDYIGVLNVNGFERWYTVHIPPGYQAGIPLPLVVNLHAYSGTAFSQEEMSQMNAKADDAGFIVVNPQAAYDPPTWTGPLLDERGQPDLDFFSLLLTTLQREISIDPARIYAAGMSNGATMTNTLGCMFSETFAAIAPVAGGHSGYGICPIERPVSVLVIHGTSDFTIPYEGRAGEVPSVHAWVEAWAKRNGCDPEAYVFHPQDGVRYETWDNCDEGVVVRLIAREGGGHVWPGSTNAVFSEGRESEMNATDVIWTFFDAHPRPSESASYHRSGFSGQ